MLGAAPFLGEKIYRSMKSKMVHVSILTTHEHMSIELAKQNGCFYQQHLPTKKK